MSISALTNQPVDMTIGGTTIKLRKPGMLRLIGDVQSRITSEYMAAAVRAAKDAGADAATVKAMLAAVPSGAELTRLAFEYLASPQGVAMVLAAAAVDPKLTTDAAWEIIQAADPAEIEALMAYALGAKPGDDSSKKSVSQQTQTG